MKQEREAEDLIVQADAAKAISAIAQVATAAGLAVASGPAMPAVAAVALVIGVFLALKAGHKTLIATLNLYYNRFMSVYNFIQLTEFVISEMEKITRKKYDFENSTVKMYAAEFKLHLLAIAPPSVMKRIKEAEEQNKTTNIKKSSGYWSRFTRFASKTMGTTTRVMYSGYYNEQTIKKFQEFLNACINYQNRIFFYLLKNNDTFKKVMDIVETDPRYLKIYAGKNIDPPPETLILKAATASEGSPPLNMALVTQLQEIVAKAGQATEAHIAVAHHNIAVKLANKTGIPVEKAEENLRKEEQREEHNATEATEVAAHAQAVVTGLLPTNAATKEWDKPKPIMLEGQANQDPRPPLAGAAAAVLPPVANEWAKPNLFLAPNNKTVQVVLEGQNYQSKKNVPRSGNTTGNQGEFNKLTSRTADEGEGEGEGEGEDPTPHAPYRQVIEVGGTRRNKLRRRKQKTQRRKRQQRQQRQSR